MPPPYDRSTELTAFLVERRGAISPESVGFPPRLPGPGRTTSGLSQEQMDQLTDRSPGTYNRVENGKVSRVSDEYLEALARILRLTEQEWTVLWRLVRVQNPPHSLYNDSGMAVPGVWRDVVEGVTGGVMAYVNDSSWNLLTCNEAFRDLFPGRVPPKNTMRWMLLDPQAREETLIDWETRWAPMVAPQVRHAVQLRKTDPTLRKLEEDALADPIVGPIYERTADAQTPYPDGSDRPLKHSLYGPGWVSTCVAEPVTSPGARLILLSYTSGPEATTRRSPLRYTS